MKRLPKQYLLAEGYLWYIHGSGNGFMGLKISTQPANTEGNFWKPFKIKWHASTKVRVLIEKVIDKQSKI